MRMWVRSLASLCGLKVQHRGVGHRGSSDPVLLWLWYGPTAAALTEALAWDLPRAVGVALKRKRKKKILTHESQARDSYITAMGEACGFEISQSSPKAILIGSKV